MSGEGWVLYRNVNEMPEAPHDLHFDGQRFALLNDAEADAFDALIAAAPSADLLPEGVHEAPDGTLLWHALVCSLPEGYEAFRNGCWGQMGHDPRHDWWFAVRPIRLTELVQWEVALRERLTIVSTEDTHIEVHHAWVNDEDVHVGRLGVGSAIADDDGNVEVVR